MKTIRTSRTTLAVKGLLLAGALIVPPAVMQISTLPAQAQTSHTDYGKQAGQIADYAASVVKQLNLTDTQKAQIKAIAQKYAPQIRAVVTDESLSSAEKKAALAKLRAAIRTEVEVVLTPKQKAQLTTLRTTIEKQVKALVEKIAAQVNLTEEQKSSIKTILLDARLEAAAIVTNPAASRQEKRSDLMALRTKSKGEIMNLLTPAQRSQLEAILNQIRPELRKRVDAWRAGGGLGLGLMP